MIEILPSILSADFARLGEEIARVERAGISMLHVDIMDGQFVPNLTIGPPVVRSIRKVTRLTLDVHMMVADPDKYAPAFIEAGADQVSVHQEASPSSRPDAPDDPGRGREGRRGFESLDTGTMLEDVLDVADYVLIMSVNPGFGGQRFIPNSLNKVRKLDALRKAHGLRLPIEIDGGVSPENVADVVRAGVDWVVAGSTIFHSSDPEATVRELQTAARNAFSVRV